MDVRVLGSVEVVGDDERVVTLAARQQRLLAALVARPGETCSTDSLIEAVWGASRPTSEAKALQVYISRLRRALQEAGRIRTEGRAYSLELKPGALDAVTFEGLLEDARASAAEGNDKLALSLLDRGLALWRGRAYGELAYEDFARAEAERLDELRLLAAEERAEAMLRLGRHAELLPELRSLAVAEPLRERLQEQLMVALYRCGRQTEALEAFTSFRFRLRRDLGLEPGAGLRELQRRILDHDPALTRPLAEEELAAGLPSPPNRLVGRDRELRELAGHLRREDTRLLVLTGAGGSGKTRLALEVARQNASVFADGAALVELAPLRDSGLVPGAIAAAVGVHNQLGDPLETLTAALRSRELLLVVDNAEHVRDAAPLYVDLLASARRLKLLVTSRSVLHLSGERVYPVEPLGEDAATKLFRERAQGAEPRFQPKASDDPTIHRICERLDRLPLAIELAASRIRMLTPVELLERLDTRLPLLTGGPQDLPARQRTLRATIDWSYELLDGDAQRDLVGLAVFAGGFTLEAAEAVVVTAPNRLASLLDHNLIERTTYAERSRYRMLETIREHALERLHEQRRNALMRRLAEYLVALSDSLQPEDWTGRGYPSQVLADEFHNMRVAITWALALREPELALRLATDFRWFGFARVGAQVERSRWLDAGLRTKGIVSPETRARALDAAGRIALILGDFEKSASLAEECIGVFRELGEGESTFEPLLVMGMATSGSGDLRRAKALFEEGLALARLMSDSVRVHRALHALAEVELELGNLREAAVQLEQCAAFARAAREPAHLSSVLTGLADVALMSGDLPRSARLHRESIQVVRQARLWPSPGIVYSIGGLAAVAALAGRAERAARLWGGVEHLEREWGTPLNNPERRRYERIVSSALGVPARSDPGAEPASVASAEEIVEEALKDDD